MPFTIPPLFAAAVAARRECPSTSAPRRVARCVAWAAALVTALQGAQPARPSFTGFVRCEIQAEAPGYLHQETQEWFLLDTTTPSVLSLPARWSVQGKGWQRRGDATLSTVADWTVVASPQEAMLKIQTQGDDVLRIYVQPPPPIGRGAVTGDSQIFDGDVPRPANRIVRDVSGWVFDPIQVRSDGSLAGTITREVIAGVAPQQPNDARVTVTVAWSFARRGGQAAALPPPTLVPRPPPARPMAPGSVAVSPPANGDNTSALEARIAELERRLATLENLAGSRATPGNAAGSGTASSATPPPATTAPPPATPPTSTAATTPPSSNTPPPTTPPSTSAEPGRSPALQIRQITPDSATQGASNVQVSISAQATHWQMGVTRFDFGPGVSVQAGPFITSPTEAYVVLSVAANAALGRNTVTATTGPESVRMAQGFGVTPAPTVATTAPPPREVRDPRKLDTIDISPPSSTAGTTPSGTAPGSPPSSGTTPPAQGTTPGTANPITRMPDRGGFPSIPTTPAPTAPPTSPAVATPAPTSGKYLVTITALWCVVMTKDDPFDRDGKGDEIYAAAYVRRYDRKTFQLLEHTTLRTLTYGDGNGRPERVPGGTQHSTGGVAPGNILPNGGTATRLLPPQQSLLPMRVWEGTLTDGADALVITPSIWEDDGEPSFHYTWVQTQQQISNWLFPLEKVQRQIADRRFFPLSLEPSERMSTNLETKVLNVTAEIVTIGLGIPWNLDEYFVSKHDRPIGIIQNDVTSSAVQNTVVVLTKEIIDAALAASYPTAETAAPRTVIIRNKPGILTLSFQDTSTAEARFGSINPPDRAHYLMTLQVERLDPPPTSSTSSSSTAAPASNSSSIMENLNKAAEQRANAQKAINAGGR